MRESAAAKAKRLLVERCLIVESVVPNEVSASCRGDGSVHALGWRSGAGWFCSCPVRSPSCSHLLALRSVVAVDLADVERAR